MTRSATLAEIVADVLRRSLRDGAHLCGEKLVESLIAKEMNVSQNTARDALRILEGEGWLMRRPRYGLTVCAFNSQSALELYAIRTTLEDLALSWAHPHMTERDKADLAAVIADARIQAGMNNGRGIREAIGTFHERILALSGGTLLKESLQPILNRTRLLINFRAHHEKEENPSNQLTHYGELVTHLRRNNLNAAQSTLQAIIEAEARAVVITLDLVGI
jgi:DNA-binding GntR family transcriptional regulator